MDSATLPPVPRWRKIALAACMFLSTAAIGFIQPFVPLYFQAAGMTHGQIGLVASVGTGLALLIQPLLGRLSDRLDARRPLMFVAALTAGGAYCAYPFASGLFAFACLAALGVNGMMYLGAAGGVLVGRMVGSAGGGRAYARYRVWGSVGYILVALLSGWLVDRALGGQATLDRQAMRPVFVWGPLIFFAIALITLLLPDRKNLPAAGPKPEAGPEVGGALSQNLRWFLLAFFLYQFSLYGASAYLSLYMKALGATPLWITGMFAAGVLCEVLVMTQVGHFADLYGRRPVLAIAFLIMPLRLLMYIPATGPLWVLMVQTLHGLNFGIMGAIAVVFINDLASDHHRGAAQARLSGVGGLATAIGPAVCGWISQQLGIGWMFGVMSVVGAVGAWVFVTRVHESHPAPLPLQERGPAALRPLLGLLASPPTRRKGEG